ncbi:cyclodeaminase/cyclohydrolase family protein [Paenibacillus hamazuiensis]|uniref:cyclodeaminase/cyclohydrolase family protein n=1 Tax=Paenibacillus hamazuiensis TaxID=2936508 RepID=UPI00200FEDD3|nr:cyclodeaminase/cyclohydrolase family protein [Paenibacillus hamazuiensis]
MPEKKAHAVTWDDSLRYFLEQAGSSHPTPGGGSVAALVAALGASMTSMVGSLSQGEKFAHIHSRIAEVMESIRSLTAECEHLLQADIASFNQYMNALKLPKGTEEEKDVRRKAIQEAALLAMDVPLRLIEVCRDGMISTSRIADSCNKNVISDLGIGALLFEAAAQSALLTVEINMASLKDMELKRRYSDIMSSLIREIGELKDETLQITRGRILG